MHFHSSGHTDSDSAATHSDIFGALDGALWHLDDMADYEMQGAWALDEDDPAGAWFAYKRFSALSYVRANVSNIVDRWYGRKPNSLLYSGNDREQLLRDAAERMLALVDSGSPVRIWECAEEECVAVHAPRRGASYHTLCGFSSDEDGAEISDEAADVTCRPCMAKLRPEGGLLDELRQAEQQLGDEV